ncbi:hypothetical protein [Saccharicrinis sp. FJH54]|uniref:hypothetical protein n=1 Tax=Saccharicrinis sp. FJH54 TaxID=3344665 RepID=UPI0035D42230
MNIEEVTSSEYDEIFRNNYHVFNSPDFSELNKNKVNRLYYLLFKDSKFRSGLILGEKNNNLISPFSAPFGGFTFLNNNIKLSILDDTLRTLLEWGKKKRFKSVRITLPPTIYNEDVISKQVNCLFRANFRITQIDLNYSFNTSLFNKDYSSVLWRNAKKNLKIASSNDFNVVYSQDSKNLEVAYNIIAFNRRERGFPLRMTMNQILETSKVICIDTFLCKYEGSYIAAAIVFKVTEKVVQVVYWGDNPEYSSLKTMNYLSFKVFEHYSNENIQIVDIGPSTENSIPNYGLCDFKEGIGSNISQKLTFIKEYI